MEFKQWLEASESKKAQIVRSSGLFTAWVGKQKVGYAYISNHSGHYLLDSIDVYPKYQRRGYGTQIVQAIADYLKSVGAKSLRSSNEGSGTVQMLDKVFGRQNVKHFHGGEQIDFQQAVKVMDVDYGRTGSKIDFSFPTPPKPIWHNRADQPWLPGMEP